MNQFRTHRIFFDSETVAEQLKIARQEKKIKIENVARKLNISQKYLEALEKGDFDKLPTGVYGKNFLREYSLFLGLDYHELEKILQKEITAAENSTRNILFSRQKAKSLYFLAMPKIIKNIIISIVIIVCFIYLALAVRKIIAPPYLLIEAPQQNLVTKKKTINITGVAETEAQIAINGKQTLSDSDGRFAENVSLKNGINVITVTAKKKYGRETVIKR